MVHRAKDAAEYLMRVEKNEEISVVYLEIPPTLPCGQGLRGGAYHRRRFLSEGYNSREMEGYLKYVEKVTGEQAAGA
jgi:hypothetical protein